MPNFQAQPTRTQFLDSHGYVSEPWLRYFQEITVALSSNGKITGSRSGNAALANLLSNLNGKGIIIDETTP